MACNKLIILVAVVITTATCVTEKAHGDDYTKIWSDFVEGGIYSVVTGDQDNDGIREIIVAADDNKVYLFEYNSDNDYRLIWNSRDVIGDYVRAVAADDTDNDGKKEIIASSDDGKIYVFECDANNKYTLVWNSGNTINSYIRSIIIGELDEDGKKEIIAGTDKNRVYVFECTGDNGYSMVWSSGSSITDWVRSVAVGDSDGDGKQEIIAGGDDAKIYVFEYIGDNSYSLVWNSMNIITDWIRSVTIGDQDEDGKGEIIVGSDDDNVYVLECTGDNNFSLVWNSGNAISDDVNSVATGDVDSDGQAEIIIGSDDNKVYVFECTEDNSYSLTWNSEDVIGASVYSVTTGDQDNDTKREIIVGAGVFLYVFESVVGNDTTPPTSFDLFSPDGNTWLRNPSPTLSWTPASDSESGIACYELYIDNLPNRSIPGVATSTTPVQPLSPGTHTWYVVAKNKAGLTTRSSSTYILKIDTVPPTITIEYPLSNKWYTDTVTSYYGSIDEPLSGIDWTTLEYNYDHQGWVSFPGDGTHGWNGTNIIPLTTDTQGKTLQIRVKDKADNVGTSSLITIRVDTSIPAPTITSYFDSSRWYAAEDIGISWEAGNDTSGIDGYSYVLDQNVDTVPNTIKNLEGITTFITLSDVEDGIWYFHLRAKDNAGNWSTTTHLRINIDNTLPSVPVVKSSTHPEKNRWYPDNHTIFSWAASDDMSGINGFSYLLDEEPDTIPDDVSEGTETTATFDIEDGVWYFHIKARNGAGLWSDTSHYQVKVDTTSPTTFILSSPPDNTWLNDILPTFSWEPSSDTESNIVEYELYIDNLLNRRVIGTITSTTPQQPLSSGTHTWYVIAKNNSGLTTISSAIFTFNIDPSLFSISSEGGSIMIDDGTRIIFPSGSIENTIMVRVRDYKELDIQMDETIGIPWDNNKGEAKFQIIRNTIRKIEIVNNDHELKTSIRIELPYSDIERNDNSRIKIDDLRVCRLNENVSPPVWEIITNTGYGIDKEREVVWINIRHLSIYALAHVKIERTIEERSLQHVYVYPNPFISSEGHDKFTFMRLTETGTIKIYNLVGELVRAISIINGTAEWNAKNDEGEDVASGVYVYVVKGEGHITRGKIVVIK